MPRMNSPDDPGPGRLGRPLGLIAALLILAALIVVGMALVSVRSMRRSMDSLDWLNHVQTVIPESAEAVADLYAAEAAYRAQVVSASSEDRAVMRQAFEDAVEHVTVLQALAGPDDQKRALTQRLLRLVEERRDELLGALAGPSAPSGLAKAAAIREAADQVRNAAQVQLAQRDSENYREAYATRWILWMGLGLNMGLLGTAGWFFRREIQARRRRAELLQAQVTGLSHELDHRQEELSAAGLRSSRDADDLQWLNHALLQQTRYNEVILNSLREGVLVVTKAMRVSRINQAVTARTGLAGRMVLGKPLDSVLRLEPGGTESGGTEPLLRALKAGRELNRQPAVASGVQSREHPVRLTLIPLRAGDAVVGGVVVLEFDPVVTTAAPTL
jgi:PAS domain-containing protein